MIEESTATTTETLPPWVARYVGIPFQERGETIAGVDCWGLLSLVLREQFGLDLPAYPWQRWNEGARGPDIGNGATAYAVQFEPIASGAEKPGDGVLLRLHGLPTHVGLVIAPGWMLHASRGAHSCVESYARPAWRHRVLGFYRYRP